MTNQLPAALQAALDADYLDAIGRPWPIEETSAPESHRADRARAMAAALRWAHEHHNYGPDWDCPVCGVAAALDRIAEGSHE